MHAADDQPSRPTSPGSLRGKAGGHRVHRRPGELDHFSPGRSDRAIEELHRRALSRLPLRKHKIPRAKHQTPGRKHQTPNTKLQINPNVQVPNSFRHLGGLELFWCLDLGVWCFHSYLSASIGSTRVARLAGSQHASNATRTNATATAARVSRSPGLTSNSRLVRKRDETKAPASPMP